MSLPSLADIAHASIYARLSGDTGVGGLLYASAPLVQGIFDDVPDAQAYPYIVMASETSESPDDVFGAQGMIVTTPIHVWSQYQGAKEAWTIIGRIVTLLDRYALSVTPYVLEECVKQSAMVTRDPDGRTRHGVVTIRVRASES